MDEATQAIEGGNAAKRLGYGPVAAVLVAIGAFVASQLIAGAVIVLILVLLGSGNMEITNWLETSVTAQFLTVVLMEGVVLWLLWQFLRSRKVRLSAIGLVKPRVRDIGYVLAGYAMYFVILIVVTQLASRLIPGLNMNQEQELGFDKTATGSALWLIFASLVILPPIVEEILTRGFLYTGLRTKLPVAPAAIITSTLFAAAHLWGGTGGDLLWSAALDTFTLSLVLVALREKTGSLWPGIGVHMLKNAVAFSVLFIFKVS